MWLRLTSPNDTWADETLSSLEVCSAVCLQLPSVIYHRTGRGQRVTILLEL